MLRPPRPRLRDHSSFHESVAVLMVLNAGAWLSQSHPRASNMGGSLMHPDEMGHCTKIVVSTLSGTVAARLVPERIRAKFRTWCLHSRHIAPNGTAMLFVAPRSLYNHAHHTSQNPCQFKGGAPPLHLISSHYSNYNKLSPVSFSSLLKDVALL